MNQHLGVAARPEHVPAYFELVPQLEVVVDLAVVNDADVPVLVRHRLCTAGDIDHAQPHVREADPVVCVEAEPIGPTMPDRGRHALEQLGRDAARPLAGDACQAAHQPAPPDWWSSTSGTRSTSSGGRCSARVAFRFRSMSR